MSFTAVTFYTRGTPYEEMQPRWARSLAAHGVERFVAYAKSTQGRWEADTNQKPLVIREALQALQEPVVWLDVDAEVMRPPRLFWTYQDEGIDFACHYLLRGRRRELLSGTLYFGHTQKARELLDRWCERADRARNEWDQRNLEAVVPQVKGLRRVELPAEYCAIDFMRIRDPVIFHHQASRQNRKRKRRI